MFYHIIIIIQYLPCILIYYSFLEARIIKTDSLFCYGTIRPQIKSILNFMNQQTSELNLGIFLVLFPISRARNKSAIWNDPLVMLSFISREHMFFPETALLCNPAGTSELILNMPDTAIRVRWDNSGSWGTINMRPCRIIRGFNWPQGQQTRLREHCQDLPGHTNKLLTPSPPIAGICLLFVRFICVIYFNFNAWILYMTSQNGRERKFS